MTMSKLLLVIYRIICGMTAVALVLIIFEIAGSTKGPTEKTRKGFVYPGGNITVHGDTVRIDNTLGKDTLYLSHPWTYKIPPGECYQLRRPDTSARITLYLYSDIN